MPTAEMRYSYHLIRVCCMCHVLLTSGENTEPKICECGCAQWYCVAPDNGRVGIWQEEAIGGG